MVRPVAAEPRDAFYRVYGLLFSLLAVVVLVTIVAVPPTPFPHTRNALPHAATALPERTSHPLLGIDYTGTYWLIADGKGEPVAPHALRDRLLELYQSRPGRVLFLSASPATEYSRISRVLEAARAANVVRISLMASCPPGKEALVERCRA